MIATFQVENLIMGTIVSGYLIKRLEGFEFPEIDVDIKERGNQDGASLGRYRYSRRNMAIELQIYANSLEDYEVKRKELFRVLRLTGLKTFYITTKAGAQLQFDAIPVARPSAPYSMGDAIVSDVRIDLTSPYPFLLSQNLISNTFFIFEGGGWAVPFGVPLDMGGGVEITTPIVNNGNGDVYPIIKLHGIMENPTITNETTGKSLSITYDLATEDDYIEIDMYYRTVKLNGSTNIRQEASGDFWTLAFGSNIIKLTAGSQGAGARAEVAYRESYIGI